MNTDVSGGARHIQYTTPKINCVTQPTINRCRYTGWKTPIEDGKPNCGPAATNSPRMAMYKIATA